jgi:hypothetical protein
MTLTMTPLGKMALIIKDKITTFTKIFYFSASFFTDMMSVVMFCAFVLKVVAPINGLVVISFKF